MCVCVFVFILQLVVWSVQDAPGEMLYVGTVVLLCTSCTGRLYCAVFIIVVGHVIDFGYFR